MNAAFRCPELHRPRQKNGRQLDYFYYEPEPIKLLAQMKGWMDSEQAEVSGGGIVLQVVTDVPQRPNEGELKPNSCAKVLGSRMAHLSDGPPAIHFWKEDCKQADRR